MLGDLELRYYLYTFCGAIVCVTSTIELIVFSSSKDFRQKFVIFNAISFSNMINGVSFVAAGVFRNIYLWNGEYYKETTSLECLFGTPWAILLLVAGQLPALLHLFLSLERVAALQFPSWYRGVWTDGHKVYMVAAAFAITATLFLFTVLLGYVHEIRSIDRICAVMNSTGIVFGTVHYTTIAFIYMFCFVILMIIFRKTNKNKNVSRTERRRQMLLQSLNAASVILVSIPNIILILNEWELPKINALVVGIIYCLYAIHSTLSLPMYIYFRPDFRRRLFGIFLRRTEESVVTTNVVVISAKATSKPIKRK